MSSFFDFDEMFEELQKMMKKLAESDDVAKELADGQLNGQWEVKQIDEPTVKGYVIRGSFHSDQPLGRFSPFEPPDLMRRPQEPERPFSLPKDPATGQREPLLDIFEGADEVKIYAELPGEDKNSIHLNVTNGEVEIKAKNFYRTIKVPADIDLEKASSRHRNNVLEVTLPKKTRHDATKRMIKID